MRPVIRFSRSSATVYLPVWQEPLLFRVVVFALLVLFEQGCAATFSQPQERIATWKLSLRDQEGVTEGVLAVIQANGGFTGTITTDGGEISLSAVEVTGDLENGRISFEIPFVIPQGVELTSKFSGQMASSRLRGELTMPVTMGMLDKVKVEGTISDTVIVWLCGNHKPRHAALTSGQRQKLSSEKKCMRWAAH